VEASLSNTDKPTPRIEERNCDLRSKGRVEKEKKAEEEEEKMRDEFIL